ncbi:MAG: hypothetical protein P1P78_11335 [Methyloprofundus sp.]|nr:hypothetical protein [Methyloprofundus sp.]
MAQIKLLTDVLHNKQRYPLGITLDSDLEEISDKDVDLLILAGAALVLDNEPKEKATAKAKAAK